MTTYSLLLCVDAYAPMHGYARVRMLENKIFAAWKRHVSLSEKHTHQHLKKNFAIRVFFVSTKRTVSAAIAGATEVPVRGANSNTHRPPQKKRRGASEIPPPRHARLDHPPVRRRPQAAGHAGLLVGFSSRSTPVGAVSHVAPGLLRPGSTRG